VTNSGAIGVYSAGGVSALVRDATVAIGNGGTAVSGIWMVVFRQLLDDIMLAADAIEGATAKGGADLGIAAAIRGRINEGDAIIRQHRLDEIRECSHDIAQEGGAFYLSSVSYNWLRRTWRRGRSPGT
jgi:hypothetical protein